MRFCPTQLEATPATVHDGDKSGFDDHWSDLLSVDEGFQVSTPGEAGLKSGHNDNWIEALSVGGGFQASTTATSSRLVVVLEAGLKGRPGSVNVE